MKRFLMIFVIFTFIAFVGLWLLWANVYTPGYSLINDLKVAPEVISASPFFALTFSIGALACGLSCAALDRGIIQGKWD